MMLLRCRKFNLEHSDRQSACCHTFACLLCLWMKF